MYIFASFVGFADVGTATRLKCSRITSSSIREMYQVTLYASSTWYNTFACALPLIHIDYRSSNILVNNTPDEMAQCRVFLASETGRGRKKFVLILFWSLGAFFYGLLNSELVVLLIITKIDVFHDSRTYKIARWRTKVVVMR